MRDEERRRRVREVFEEWAAVGRAEGMERGHGPAARQAFDLLELRSDSRYLDIGCGNGYTVRWAAERAPEGRAVGIDLAPAMIDRARALSAHLPHAELRVAAFPDVDLPPASFDAIFSMETFYYLPDLDAALTRTRELLVPGGRFACVVDYYEENPSSHGWPDELGVPMTLLSGSGWADAFRRAGLDVVEQRRLLAPGEGDAAWKAEQGSLLTLGRR